MSKQTRTRGEDYEAPVPVPKAKRTRGRPATYEESVIPEAAALAQQGLTDKEIAAELGIHVGTFWRWFSEHPELREAVRAAGKTANNRVRMSLYNRAIEGSDTASIFWLKNREPDEWRDRRETEIIVPVDEDTAAQLDSRSAALAALALFNEAQYDPTAAGILLEATANAEESDDGEDRGHAQPDGQGRRREPETSGLGLPVEDGEDWDEPSGYDLDPGEL